MRKPNPNTGTNLEFVTSRPERSPQQGKRRRGRNSVRREDVVSALLAEEAANLDFVERFREDALGGQLLEPKDCMPWVRQEKREYPYPKTVGQARREDFDSSELGQIHLQLPGQDGESIVTYLRRGVLEELAHWADRLAREFSWSKGEATVFLLAGCPPFVPLARARLQMGHPAASRIVMEVDPRISQAQLLEVFADAKRHPFFNKRPHAIGDANLRVLAFSMQHQDMSYPAQMDAWNRRYGGEVKQYTSPKHFWRDVNDTRSRLLNGAFNPDE